MNTEDQLRAAGRAISDQIRDLPELDLTTSVPSRADTRPPRRFRRWQAAWLIPVAAAVAVIAVAATLVTTRTLTGAGHPAGSVPAAARDTGQVPRYYAAITAPAAGAASDVTIAATATGEARFTVKPPAKTTFANVTAAADDRTFVVALSRFPNGMTPYGGTVGWYRLRLNPGATSYTLRRLPVPAPPGNALLYGVALSPDGTELAVMFHDATAAGAATSVNGGPTSLRVYSVTTGQILRTWTDANGQSLDTSLSEGTPDETMTWLASGHELAFDWVTAKKTGPNSFEDSAQEVRRLDLAKPGTNLLAASTPSIAISGWVNGVCRALRPAADGSSAVCGTEAEVLLPQGGTTCSFPPMPLYFKAYSGLHGQYRTLYTVQPFKAVKEKCSTGTAEVLWASSSGSTVVGVVSRGYTPGSSLTSVVGVIAGGHWKPLPASVLKPGHAYQVTEFAF